MSRNPIRVQLTDAMRLLACEQGLLALSYEGKSYDAGDKLGFLKATVEFGLENPEFGQEFRDFMASAILIRAMATTNAVEAGRQSDSGRQAGGRAAFAYPDFKRYEYARFAIVVASEMQSVAVGWQIYDLTKSALALGLAGLVQFLPSMLLFLVSGHAADRIERRKLLLGCYVAFGVCSALLLAASIGAAHAVLPIFGVLVLVGAARSFSFPVSRAFLPQLVPEEHFPNAVAWHTGIFQTATILGPAIGGVLYAALRGPAGVYAIAVGAAAVSFWGTLRIEVRSKASRREEAHLERVLAGLRYIWNRKVILGSISLDLFAVLLGGAVALLPVYARDILRTGPWGLGLLRCAPGLGAAVMAVVLAYRPLRRNAGMTMLWCVAGFGLCTILFGVSRSLLLSMAALFLVGATDMVSVVIRGILVQVETPDEMRGRVNAVDMIFIGASNEFGQFESGVTASWLGAVPAVILGGIGAIVVTAIWAWSFPALRNADRLVNSPEGSQE